MLFSIWNWLTGNTIQKEESVKNLLLTKCLRKRYLKQRNSIIIIQRYVKQYLATLHNEEDIYIQFQRFMMKDRNKLFA